MGFSEDVEQIRIKRAEVVSREEEAALAFSAELEELWRDAREYWSTKTMRFTADEVGWILHGSRYVPVGGDELVPLPVFPQRVAKGPRPRADFDRGFSPRTISVPGFVIMDGIAFCEPGQLRPMTPRVLLDMPRHHAEQLFRTGGFFDLAVGDLPAPSPFPEPSHQVAFGELSTGRHVAFGRTGETPIEVWAAVPSAGGFGPWTYEGTLQNLVATALSDAIDKHG